MVVASIQKITTREFGVRVGQAPKTTKGQIPSENKSVPFSTPFPLLFASY